MSKLDTIVTDAYLRKADLMTSPDFKSEKAQATASKNYKAATKQEIKDLMLDLLNEARQKGGPLTWLEATIKEL